jgi:porphobilinogen deaminase
VGIERAVLAGLAGGCSLPLGCLARRGADGGWRLRVRLGQDQGALRELDLAGPARDLAAQALARLR